MKCAKKMKISPFTDTTKYKQSEPKHQQQPNEHRHATESEQY
jgi:hypothetical protein